MQHRLGRFDPRRQVGDAPLVQRAIEAARPIGEAPVALLYRELESAGPDAEVRGRVSDAQYRREERRGVGHRRLFRTDAVGFRHEAVEQHRRALVAAQPEARPRLQDARVDLVALDEEQADAPGRGFGADAAEEEEVRRVSGRRDIRLAHVRDFVAAIHLRHGREVAHRSPVVAVRPRLRARHRREHLAAGERFDEALDLVGRRHATDHLRSFEVHLVAHRRRRALLRQLLDDQRCRHEVGAGATVLLRGSEAPESGLAQRVQLLGGVPSLLVRVRSPGRKLKLRNLCGRSLPSGLLRRQGKVAHNVPPERLNFSRLSGQQYASARLEGSALSLEATLCPP